MNSYFLYGAPSPTCYPHGGHWGHPGKCHQQPLFFTQLHFTQLDYMFYLNWIWRKKFEICKVLALGALPWAPHRSHMYHMNNFESPALKDDSCHVWLKSNHAFSKEDETVTFYKGPTGAHWGHPGNCHEQLLFFI